MELAELRNLAHLARIEFSDEELQKIGADFASILGYVEQINSIDISEIESLELQTNVVRPDINPNSSGAYRAAMLADAPASQDGFYKVPKIL
jgi:aspartyl-tRNA(Asn)/glutamyl-tRNA(Gln) amidotransferase subunit C